MYTYGKHANGTFCPKYKTKMSIFYQLNMFKILRYFTEHSTRHKPTGYKPMSPNEYHYTMMFSFIFKEKQAC